MKLSVGGLTTEEIFKAAVELGAEFLLMAEELRELYAEIDVRIDVADYMALAGRAAKEGKLITDEWLWNDLEVEEEVTDVCQTYPFRYVPTVEKTDEVGVD